MPGKTGEVLNGPPRANLKPIDIVKPDVAD